MDSYELMTLCAQVVHKPAPTGIFSEGAEVIAHYTKYHHNRDKKGIHMETLKRPQALGAGHVCLYNVI